MADGNCSSFVLRISFRHDPSISLNRECNFSELEDREQKGNPVKIENDLVLKL